jgi:glucose-6-phosphate isomerase
MIIKALKRTKVKFHFINNIDSDEIHDCLQELNPETSLFYFASKSGGTAETMASLAICTNWLIENGISPENFNRYMVFATDPLKSDLLKLAEQWKISCLEIPTNVGGRFCALTPVGYFPAFFAGVNLEQLVLGAEEIKASLLCETPEKNLLKQIYAPLFDLYSKENIRQTVLMPYSSKLKELSAWFVQLWAESLGKKFDNQGQTIESGFTPLAAYGATDQHSQMQLFMEGPRDKCLIFLEIEDVKHELSLRTDLDLPAFKALRQHQLSDLMKAELYGTIMALQEAKRPLFHLVAKKNDEYHLGAIILLFEALTVIMGHGLNVNPFDQPGVEAGKRYAFDWLSKTK